MRLEKKVALITGGAQGLGKEIARRFTGEGASVIIADVNEKGMEDCINEFKAENINVECVKLDVTSEESWIKAIEQTVRNHKKIDILVNNAGTTIRAPFTELNVADYDRIMSLNVKGPFLGVKHVIPVMQKNGGGAIINMSSICGLIGHKFSGESYIVSKGAVTLLTKTVAVKYAKYNIRCNSIHPSTVDTPLSKELFKDPEKKKERVDEIPLGRLCSVLDVANAALFLASDEASFINGAALPVDGGLTAY
jgi:NAD(P)-dependent dehydrogenase (short-subunit alcohol dehydrogenase family)